MQRPILLLKTYRAAIKQFQSDLVEIIEDDALTNEIRNQRAFDLIAELEEIVHIENQIRLRLLSQIGNDLSGKRIDELLKPLTHWYDTDCLISAVVCDCVEIFDKLILVGFMPDDNYCSISSLGKNVKSILMLERLIVLGLEISPGMLETAINENNYGLCKFLISKNIEVNIFSSGGITPLIYACDHASPEIVQLLIDAGADYHVTYPYAPNRGNLLDRVMLIPDDGHFCVPYAIEKAIILITTGLSPSTQYLSDFIEIIKRCDVGKHETYELMLLCQDKKYFDSDELEQLCEPIIELVNAIREHQIAEFNNVVGCDSDISGIIADFVYPLEYQSALGSVRFFQSTNTNQNSNGAHGMCQRK